MILLILRLKSTSFSVNIEMFNNPINSRKQKANGVNPVVFVEKKEYEAIFILAMPVIFGFFLLEQTKLRVLKILLSKWYRLLKFRSRDLMNNISIKVASSSHCLSSHVYTTEKVALGKLSAVRIHTTCIRQKKYPKRILCGCFEIIKI